ncbi:hypothetical protein D3C71_1026670 [compost metagenome]
MRGTYGIASVISAALTMVQVFERSVPAESGSCLLVEWWVGVEQLLETFPSKGSGALQTDQLWDIAPLVFEGFRGLVLPLALAWLAVASSGRRSATPERLMVA